MADNTSTTPAKALEAAPIAYITEDDTETGELTAAAVLPTQVRRPWRATVRTVFAALVSLAALAPLIAEAVEEATGYDLSGVPFVVVVLAVCAAVTRVMAVPAVEVFLKRFLPFLAAGGKA